MRPSGGLEVAEIFRQHGPAYRESHRLSRNALRVMRAIEVCRTAVLGGHKDQCDHCGHLEISYNSCRNGVSNSLRGAKYSTVVPA